MDILPALGSNVHDTQGESMHETASVRNAIVQVVKDKMIQKQLIKGSEFQLRKEIKTRK